MPSGNSDLIIDPKTRTFLRYKGTSGDVGLVVEGTERLTIPTAAQAAGRVLVSSGSALTPVAISGDATLSSAGALTIAAAAVEASMIGANLRTGHIPLDIFTARIISAGAIQNTTEAGVPDGNTAPSIARVNGATDKQGRLAWAAAGVEEIQFAPFAYPADLDDSAILTVNLLMAMAGATDIPVVSVSYWEGVGDTNAGGDTAAVTGTSIVNYTRDIAAADIGSFPKVASIGLTPAAHGTDVLYLYAAWISYTRRS